MDKDTRTDLEALLEHPATHDFEDWTLDDRVYDVTLTPFGGDSNRCLVFLRDVTSRRQMERRLTSAEKMASLGVLSAGIAHEINNPIAFVKANATHTEGYFEDLFDLLDQWRAATAGLDNDGLRAVREAEEALDLEDMREDAALMVRDSISGVERIQKIVASLKGFAHPDTEKVRGAQLNELVENAVLLTQGKWKYKLDLERNFGEVSEIHCLPSQLEQVFMNLIVNAAQAAESWGRLEITTEATETGARLRFTDTCGGIPEHIVERIFDPFFTTKDIGEGTGLGLAISHNIIQGHGGQLKVETEIGQGTTFIVDLPFGEAGQPMVVKQHSRFRI